MFSAYSLLIGVVAAYLLSTRARSATARKRGLWLVAAIPFFSALGITTSFAIPFSLDVRDPRENFGVVALADLIVRTICLIPGPSPSAA